MEIEAPTELEVPAAAPTAWPAQPSKQTSRSTTPAPFGSQSSPFSGTFGQTSVFGKGSSSPPTSVMPFGKTTVSNAGLVTASGKPMFPTPITNDSPYYPFYSGAHRSSHNEQNSSSRPNISFNFEASSKFTKRRRQCGIQRYEKPNADVILFFRPEFVPRAAAKSTACSTKVGERRWPGG